MPAPGTDEILLPLSMGKGERVNLKPGTILRYLRANEYFFGLSAGEMLYIVRLDSATVVVLRLEEHGATDTLPRAMFEEHADCWQELVDLEDALRNRGSA
jgi:hypothetical protein